MNMVTGPPKTPVAFAQATSLWTRGALPPSLTVMKGKHMKQIFDSKAMPTLPAIPNIEDEELNDAVSALANAAQSIHTVLLVVAAENSRDEDVSSFIRRHCHHIEFCEHIIQFWNEQLSGEALTKGMSVLDLRSLRTSNDNSAAH